MHYRSSFGPYTINPVVFKERIYIYDCRFDCMDCFYLCFLWLLEIFKEHGMKTEVDISRVLGKDAKDALNFGDVGILTYNEEYIVTWASPSLKRRVLR